MSEYSKSYVHLTKQNIYTTKDFSFLSETVHLFLVYIWNKLSTYDSIHLTYIFNMVASYFLIEMITL